MSISQYRQSYATLSKHVLQLNPRHVEASVSCSQDDTSGPNDFLIGLALQAISTAWKTEIEYINPVLPDSRYYNVFPGEHYRLLNALMKLGKHQTVVEVGTFTGMGSKSLLQSLDHGVLHTYDVIPYQNFQSHLTPADFTTGKLKQHIADLSQPEVFAEHQILLDSADVIFLDGPKDGVFEYRLLDLLQQLKPKPWRLMIIDDIRFVNMTDAWRSIQNPKLDLTSFGHWSGTGLVDLSQGLHLN